MGMSQEELLEENKKLKKALRFTYLTLGFYGTPYNYSEDSAILWIDNTKIKGILRDGGQDAREASEFVKKLFSRDEILKWE